MDELFFGMRAFRNPSQNLSQRGVGFAPRIVASEHAQEIVFR